MLHTQDISYTNLQADGRAQQQPEAHPQVGMAAGGRAGGQAVSGEPEPWLKRQM